MSIIFGALVFVVFFQNCEFTDQPITPSSMSLSSSGNGGVYGGMQPPQVAGSVKAGQSTLITIIGGQGPFQVRSQNTIGQIVAISEREFIWSIPEDATAQVDRIVATDSLGEQTAAEVRILVLTQEEIQYSFGKAVAQTGNYLLFGVELQHGAIGEPQMSCPSPGALQIFTKEGRYISQVPPVLEICDKFGAALSASGSHIIVSGMKNTKTTMTSNVSVQAGAVIYQINDRGEVEQEQILTGTRPSYWGWVDVGISGDRAFLHYSSSIGNDSVIEIYRRQPQQGMNSGTSPWILERVLDFSRNNSEIVFSRTSIDGIGSVKFSESDQDLIVHIKNTQTNKDLIRIYSIDQNGEWAIKEDLDVLSLMPQEVRSLGTNVVVTGIQKRFNEIFFSTSWATIGDHYTHDRIVVLQQSSEQNSWKVLDILVPPDGGMSYNESYHSSVGKDYLIMIHSILRQLIVYKKINGHYVQSIDLSMLLMKNGFARDGFMRENQIIIPYYSQVFVMDLK